MAQSEADAADVKIIHPQVSQFETESFVVQVTTERFTANTMPSTHWIRLGDLVAGTFDVREHTPVTAMGLNRLAHYKMESEAAWHKLGDHLCLKAAGTRFWGDAQECWRSRCSRPLPEGDAVPVRVKVQPSTKVLPHGAYFETNEHYRGTGDEPLRGLLQKLRERWAESQESADRIANHIIHWAR